MIIQNASTVSMGLIPEKRTGRQEVRQAIASQFWGQTSTGPRSLSGCSGLLPCEPPPLAQSAPSGLARAQQLLAWQACALPFLPGLNGDRAGAVRQWHH